MRYYVVVVVIGLCLFGVLPSLSYAFSPNIAGENIDIYDTGYDQLINGYESTTAIEYIGTCAGNYTVAVLFQGSAANTQQIATYSISSTGEVLDQLDIADMSTKNKFGYAYFVPDDKGNSDWYVITDNDDGAYTVSINRCGDIDVNGDTLSDGNYGIHFENITNDCIIATYGSGPTFEFHTYDIRESDGSFVDRWVQAAYIPNWWDGDRVTDVFAINGGSLASGYYGWLVADGATGKIYYSKYWRHHASHDYGDLTATITGSVTLSAIEEDNYSQVKWLYDDYYAILGAPDGSELWTEVIDIPIGYDPVLSGTAYVDKTAAGYSGGALVPYDRSAAYQYNYYTNPANQITDMKLRMGWQLGNNVSQQSISGSLTYYEGDYQCLSNFYGESVCRLGTSPYIGSIFTENQAGGANPYNIILTTNYMYTPPVVDTLSAIPLLTTYFTNIDAAIRVNGEVIDYGSTPITEYGAVYNTGGDPDYSDTKEYTTDNIEANFDFTTDIYDLDIDTEYYFRAYAVNNSGTGYGDVVNCMGFPDYAQTIVLYRYDPVDISNTEITDITGNNTITYTWLGNGSVTTTYGPINISDDLYQPGTDPVLWLYQDDAPELDEDEYVTPSDRSYTGLPGMSMINTQLDNANIQRSLFWLPFFASLAVGAGFAFYIWTRIKTLMPMAVFCGLFCFAGVAMGWFDWWYMIGYIIPAYALLLAQRSTGGTHI